MKMSSDPEKEKKEDVIFDDDEEEVSKVDIKETVKINYFD